MAEELAAYASQDAALRRAVSGGDSQIGVRVDLTGESRRQQLGLSCPVTGWLTESMLRSPGEAIDLGGRVVPMVQPELAFRLDRPLTEAVLEPATLLASIESVHAAAVITDAGAERTSWNHADMVAANLYTLGVVIGSVGTGPELDLALEACVVVADGAVIDSATGAAIDGHPFTALAHAARTLTARGVAVPAHTLVLTGGLTPAVAMAPGKPVQFEFTHLSLSSQLPIAIWSAGWRRRTRRTS